MIRNSNAKETETQIERRFAHWSSAILSSAKNLFTKFYWWSCRQPLIRYRPVIEEIRRDPNKEALILEIGPGKKKICRNKRKRIFYLDIYSEENNYRDSPFIRASASNLPFKSDSFDLVIAVDVLEHIQPKLRIDVLSDICRISRRKVIIGTPCGKKSEYWEGKARNILFDKLRYRNKDKQKDIMQSNSWLIEHFEYGLPKEDELKKFFYEYGRTNYSKFDIQVIENESLYVWYFGTLGYMRYSYVRFVFTALIFIFLLPILSRIQIGGTYRKLIIFEKVSL